MPNPNNTSIANRADGNMGLGMLAIVLCIILFIAYYKVEEKWIEYQQATELKKGHERFLATREKLKNEFLTNKESILSKIRQTQRNGDFTKAEADAIKYGFTEDKELLSLIVELDAATFDRYEKQKIAKLEESLTKTADSNTAEKLAIYRYLVVAVPQNAEYKVKLALYEKKEAIKKAKELQARKAEKKKEGVYIGMTMQDVKDSSWGRPTKVNRTTISNGVSEQWVYGGGYLYFENGILTAIQN